MGQVFLVVCTGYFGDVLLTSKLTRDIKKKFPNDKVVFICDVPYPLVVKNLPGVDEVFVYDRKIAKNPLLFLRFILNFPYKNKIKHAFVIHQYKKSRIFLAKMLGAKNVTSWEDFRMSKGNAKLIAADDKYSNIAYLNGNLLSILTGECTNDEDIEFLIPQEVQQKIDEFLETKKYSELIGINPMAGDEDKSWDVNEFVKFTKMLINAGKTPVILGISKDGTTHIEALLNDNEINQDDYINMVDKTNFVELGALCKRCSLVVSIDTGTAHMANAVGATTLVLFFKDMARHWAPINIKQNSFIYKLNISAEEVFEIGKQKLEISNIIL